MRIEQRNNIRINEAVSPANGANTATMVFMHGFGCDQTMWRYWSRCLVFRYRTVAVRPGRQRRFRTWTADHVDRYARLDAHGADSCWIFIHAVCGGPVIPRGPLG